MQQLTSEMEELKETSESKISRLTEERDAARDDHERLTSRSHTHTHTNNLGLGKINMFYCNNYCPILSK